MMPEFSPYEAYRLIMEKGAGIHIRDLAAIFRSENEDLDDTIIRIDESIDSYHRECEVTGEHPVVTMDINDRIVSNAPTTESLEERLSLIRGDVDDGNKSVISYYLRTMPWAHFESLCGELFEKIGFVDVKLTNRGPDGGIDFTGNCYNPLIEEMAFPVIGQAKQWSGTNKVTVHEVRELISKLATHENQSVRGFLITTSTFTADAVKEASNPKWPITLWDMGKLTSIIVENELGLKQVDLSSAIVDRAFWDRFIEGD